jgi:hypothetical protein
MVRGSGVWIWGRDRMVCGLSVGLKGGRRGQGISWSLALALWCGGRVWHGATGSLLVEGGVGNGIYVIFIFKVVLSVR